MKNDNDEMNSESQEGDKSSSLVDKIHKIDEIEESVDTSELNEEIAKKLYGSKPNSEAPLPLADK